MKRMIASSGSDLPFFRKCQRWWMLLYFIKGVVWCSLVSTGQNKMAVLTSYTSVSCVLISRHTSGNQNGGYSNGGHSICGPQFQIITQSLVIIWWRLSLNQWQNIYDHNAQSAHCTVHTANCTQCTQRTAHDAYCTVHTVHIDHSALCSAEIPWLTWCSNVRLSSVKRVRPWILSRWNEVADFVEI